MYNVFCLNSKSLSLKVSKATMLSPSSITTSIKLSEGKIWVNELYGGEGGYVTFDGTNPIIVGQ